MMAQSAELILGSTVIPGCGLTSDSNPDFEMDLDLGHPLAMC